jgi:xanthine dehydrogenase accessory factor
LNENSDILSAFESLCNEGNSSALATVVRTAGSSYRRPGARMLIAGDGQTWGGVSGGCLERDVARCGRQVIDSQKAIVRRYDTTDDFGTKAALGCAGVIDILIEPIGKNRQGVMSAIRGAMIDRVAMAVATVISDSKDRERVGRHCSEHDGDESLAGFFREAREHGRSGIRSIGAAEVFFEVIRPAQSLVIFGAGPDVAPLVAIGRTLGWHVTVVMSHGTAGSADRFKLADRVALGTEDDALGGIEIEPEAAVVLMTHNYARDLLILPRLMSNPTRYIGLLGPRKRGEQLIADCGPWDMRRVHSPVGLDLGGETPEGIALSIAAEIQTVLFARDATPLRDRPGPIYADRGNPQPSSTPGSEPQMAAPVCWTAMIHGGVSRT